MCSVEKISRLIERAAGCKYEGGCHTHAAAGTSMHPLSLPSAPEHGLMSSGVHNYPCTRNESMESTLMALLHSVKNLGSFIHIVKEGDADVMALMSVSRAVVGDKACMVFEVHGDRDDGSSSHRLYTETTGVYTSVTEDEALETLLRVQRASRAMVFYWSAAVLGYSVVLNQPSTAMWAVHARLPLPGERKQKVMHMLHTGSRSVTRVLPCFYPKPRDEAMMIMGQGGSSRVLWDDLEVGMEALCDPVVQRIYCSRAPSGRCYCCQYMVNLHQEIHSGNDIIEEEPVKLRLSKKFWQKTDSRDGRRN